MSPSRLKLARRCPSSAIKAVALLVVWCIFDVVAPHALDVLLETVRNFGNFLKVGAREPGSRQTLQSRLHHLLRCPPFLYHPFQSVVLAHGDCRRKCIPDLSRIPGALLAFVFFAVFLGKAEKTVLIERNLDGRLLVVLLGTH